MTGTLMARVGDRGRIVLPVELRERAGIHDGDMLVFLESDDGFLMLSRDQLARRVASELSGIDLVGELISDRRAEAAQQDAP